ncbi:MAG: Mur ligase family protein, partial [Actinomycetota bacterium]|nr:Mur ligase family protein [Actinomycetota bacterium]
MATLHDLSRALPHARITGAVGGDTRVHDVTHDSRSVGPGVLFACRPGLVVDGHDFAPQAVRAGASALLVERPLALGVPELVVPSVSDALGPVAARVHGDPSAAFALCGVTGTNGKTTTVYLLDAALRRAGHETGLVGTVETVVAGSAVPGVRTTPEAPELQRLLRRMADAGVTAAAMEVSSHGLALGRVRGTLFAVAVFTNLSHDHLDFHRDLDDYFRAKVSLFDPAYTPVGVVNVDDPHG